MPDSPESRLNRLETQAEVARAERDSTRRQVEAVAPLATQYAVLHSKLEDLDEDVKALAAQIESRAERLDRKRKEEHDEFTRRVENQLLSCTAEIKRVEDGVEKERKDLVSTRRNLNLALIAGVFAIGASLVSSVLPALLGG